MISPHAGLNARRVLLLCVTTALGCKLFTNGDDTGVAVTMIVSRSTAAPGESLQVTARAVPEERARVRWITIATTGVLLHRDSIPMTGSGEQQVTRTIALPFFPLAGTLTIKSSASAGGRASSDSIVVGVFDSTPPRVLALQAKPRPVGPGDRMVVTFSVRAGVGLKRVLVAVSGAFVAHDSLVPSNERSSVVDSVVFVAPASMLVDSATTVILEMEDGSGKRTAARLDVPTADTRAPAPQMTFAGLRSDSTVRVGDTLQINVNATDNGTLRYVGYGLEGLNPHRDSVAVSGSAAAQRFRLVVTPELLTNRPPVRAFARDAGRNLGEQRDPVQMPVFAWVDRPLRGVPVPFVGELRDLVIDARRNVAYLSLADYGAPDSAAGASRIVVISLTTGVAEFPLAVPARPGGIALTRSGDSLLIALPTLDALGVMDLNRIETTRIPLQYDKGWEVTPLTVRVAGSRALIALYHAGARGRVLVLDLATGTQTVRSDFGTDGQVGSYPVWLGLPSATRVLIHRNSDYPVNVSFVYDAGTNAFAQTPRLEPARDNNASATASSGFMLGGVLYGPLLTPTATLTPQDWSGAAAVAPDGAVAYFATGYGYVKIRTRDRAVLEQVRLPVAPTRLALSADGTTLLAAGPGRGMFAAAEHVVVIDVR